MSEQDKIEQQKKELYYGEESYEEQDAIQDMMDKEDECYYGCDFCLDSFLRDCCGCIGCEVIAPPPKEELVEYLDKCEDCSLLEVEEDSHGLRYPICHKKEVEKK
jgi:hypothetical protein